MEQATLGTDLLSALSNQMADAVERIGPALVQVNGREGRPASGVVFAPNLVLTADHVLEREDDLTIKTHDGRTLAAAFAGRDPATDLAVLRVADLGLADAHQAPHPARVGPFVLAVGRPTGEGPLASLGIVSALGGPLRLGQGRTLERYLQTDATPYPGFSGGPLIDTQGGVTGITTTGLVSGLALAIPAELAWRVAGTLARHGSIKRGFLGISSQPVQIPEAQRAGQAQEFGLLIVRVEPGSPAQQGGLLLGDVLLALDGVTLSATDDLPALLSGDRVGQAIPVTVLRGGGVQTLRVTVGARS
jgi:S1-C subfamily serine protease